MTSAWYLLILLVPILGFHVWASHRWKGDIVWWESLVGVAVGAFTVWGCIALGQLAIGHDTETISGAAYRATYVPEWKSNETRTETYTTGTGKNRTSHTRTVHYVETHSPRYGLETNIGDISVGSSTWDYLMSTHGATKTASRGSRPNYRSGDRNDYHLDLNMDGGGDADLIPLGLGQPDFPVTKSQGWINRLEHSDSLLRLPDLKEGEAQRLGLPDYPDHIGGLAATNRVVSGPMDVRAWDRLNAHLGPSKHVNLIIVYLGEGSTLETAQKLQQHWRNGKKNDLVLCVDKREATWSYVFGWSRSELVKNSLASALRNGPVDKSRIPDIWGAVWDDHEPYDWASTEHIPLKVPVWSVFVAVLVTAGAQWGLIRWAASNEFSQRRERSYGY